MGRTAGVQSMLANFGSVAEGQSAFGCDAWHGD